MSPLDAARAALLGKDAAGIARAPDEALARALVGLLAGWERAGDADFDDLNLLGILLVSTGKRGAEDAALRWLGEAPSAARLDLVCGILWGTWGLPARPPAPGNVRALLAACEGLGLDDQAAYDLAVALQKAINAGGDADTVRAARVRLAELKATGLSLPTMNRLLQALPG